MFRGWLTFRKGRQDAERLLAKAGTSPTMRSLHVGDRALFVVETGDPTRRPVLFIHGSPGSWTDFVHYLADAELRGRARLLAVDRPGYGDSDQGHHLASLEAQARLIACALGDLRAVIVAHSMGGPIAVRLAADFRERVAGLVLIAPTLDPRLERWHWYKRPAEWKWIAPWLPSVWRTSNREQLPLASELEALEARWPEINVPVVLIHGGRDRLVPDANLFFAVRQLENVPVHTHHLPGADHYLPWTHRPLIRGAILDLLDRLDGRVSGDDEDGRPQG